MTAPATAPTTPPPPPSPPPRSPGPAPRPAPPAARPAPAPAPRVSRLAAVTRGVIHEPWRYLLYGQEGCGKSTLAADAPGVIFLDTDRASGRLDVARYSFRDSADGYFAQSYSEILAAVDDLLHNPHDFKTLVIDTADALESLIWGHLCDGAPPGHGGKRLRSIEDFGYGKGYAKAVDAWREFCHRLDRLRLSRSIDIVFLAHSIVKTYKNPTGEDYDRFIPKLNDKATAFLREWFDVVGFVSFEDGAAKLVGDAGDGARARGWTTGRRLIRFGHSAAWDAKTRLPMPDEVELTVEHPWAPFAAAVEATRSLTPDDLRRMLAAELERLGATFTKPNGEEGSADAVAKAITDAGDNVSVLAKYHNLLAQSQPKEQAQ
jgi:hypothetical protein